jgi:hypothetical protein
MHEPMKFSRSKFRSTANSCVLWPWQTPLDGKDFEDFEKVIYTKLHTLNYMFSKRTWNQGTGTGTREYQ